MKPAIVTCAAVGCQQTIQRPLLMCVDHWRMVPAATRRQLWGAWRRIGHDDDAVATHQAAVRAAIDAVHTKCRARQDRRSSGPGGTPNLF